MRFNVFGILLASVIGFASASYAQTQPAAPVRTLLAGTKLPTVTDTPLYFKLDSVTLPAGAKTTVSGANALLYQTSGMTEVVLDGETKVIKKGEGLFVGAGKTATVTANGGPSAFLYFTLSPAAGLDRAVVKSPAVVKELYRTAAPVPDLKAGAYDMNATLVTFPAQMPSNAPHHRSGAALYYVISGTGINTIGSQVTSKPPGSLIYEPYRVVHQWGVSGNEPLTFVAFNINPEGVAAVLQGEVEK